LSPEIKIISYIAFVVGLIFIKDLTVYLFLFIAVSIILCRVPFESVKKGWLPISLFLLFTFLSNMVLQRGRVLFSIGSFVITEEGLTAAILRTGRVFLMIAGAKILTATTETEALVEALGKLLRPLEYLRLPVKEFFSTMGLTIRSLPRIKETISETYREGTQRGDAKGFLARARVVSLFLVPLFVKSMQAPERFFEDDPNGKEKGNRSSMFDADRE
jgi:energy-coupling factor transport system permease protein